MKSFEVIELGVASDETKARHQINCQFDPFVAKRTAGQVNTYNPSFPPEQLNVPL